MTINGWVQIALFVAIIIAITPPIGAFLAAIAEGRRNFLTPVLGPVENGIYRLAGDGSSSRLDFRILKRYWLTSLRVAPHLRSSVAPADEVSGRPDPCIYRLCLGSEFPGCPESSLL